MVLDLLLPVHKITYVLSFVEQSCCNTLFQLIVVRKYAQYSNDIVEQRMDAASVYKSRTRLLQSTCKWNYVIETISNILPWPSFALLPVEVLYSEYAVKSYILLNWAEPGFRTKCHQQRMWARRLSHESLYCLFDYAAPRQPSLTCVRVTVRRCVCKFTYFIFTAVCIECYVTPNCLCVVWNTIRLDD